jgi:glucose/arabinose dehydrogenase
LVAGVLFFTATAGAEAETPPNALTPSEAKSGWRLLFDGETTAGWRNYNKPEINDKWVVKDGALVRTGGGAGDIVSQEQFGNFELSLEYKISEEGNSGLMFRVLEGPRPPWHTGPEVQIQDNVNGHDPQKAGWLYQLYKPGPGLEGDAPLDATRPVGEWNQLYLRVEAGQSEVCMNGVRYYRFEIGSDDWKRRVADSKFAKFEMFGKPDKGHICLQDHGDVVSFRNIKVRELGEGGSVPQPIDGQLNVKAVSAFPQLTWDGWEPVDEAGKVQTLRLMELTPARDGTNRLFAASQAGLIFTFENRPDVEQSHLFLDLQEDVVYWKDRGANEQGLLGLALHPNYAENGEVFVCYTAAEDGRTVVSRFQTSEANPNQADPDSEEVLLEVHQPFANHNGGWIEFGPDGYLYISLGDGGFRNDPQGNGQDPSTLLGSILRIDVDSKAKGRPYGIPADNPFVDDDSRRDEIFAYGFRNGWRLAFDPANGDLWCGDVGQELWEEVNVVKRGGNYGWSVREGNHPFGSTLLRDDVSQPIDPVWEYDHQIGKSITGGRVYRGKATPALEGKYLYADYVTGRIWALGYDRETGQVTENLELVSGGIPVLSFGQDAQGEIYYMIASGRGECIYRFVPADE